MLEQKRMKKIFSTLILISLLSIILIPAAASAQPVDSCTIRHEQVADFDPLCTPGVVNESVTSAWGMCCMLDAIYTVIDWVFFGLVAAVSLFTVWGAYDILTAAGDAERYGKGRQRIMWAMIGLAVALLSRAIPSLVTTIIGA
jgi:hypothetical protein